MKPWLPSWGSREVEAPPEEPRTRPNVHTSLAFNVLIHQIQPGRKSHILDLGPALGANVDYFAQFSCKLYIEDFYRTLTSFDYFSPEDGFSYEAVLEYLLPFRKSTRFDIILFWDLLNYLERDVFEHLVRHLSQYCTSGSLALALISTLKHIPEKPMNFRIVDSHTLSYESNSTVLRPCPRYQQTDLNHLMPDFRVCNSFLLRNGFKEYLFLRV